MTALINVISAWAIPALIAFIPLFAFVKKVPVYESFVLGAKDGFQTAIQIIPNLVGMMVAISVFRASGALDFFVGWISPFLKLGRSRRNFAVGAAAPFDRHRLTGIRNRFDIGLRSRFDDR